MCAHAGALDPPLPRNESKNIKTQKGIRALNERVFGSNSLNSEGFPRQSGRSQPNKLFVGSLNLNPKT